jgi:DNA (cytosine-5)-methyltransferase 1
VILKPFRYGSVCSGIEAATVAWHPLGWEPAFFSEIEKFPRAVLAHHYPDVPLHGDFTTIKGDEYGPIDLLVGGTPCQSFSVAGLRKGLSDERGNLALEYLRLASRTRPRWIVWENVPGVLSSGKGRDFGSFLGALPELGYGFAYRVLDAQYFGVAQRRRRVFVVGYLGDWRPAAAVLFERESLCGNPPPSRKAGPGIAVCPTLRAGGNRTGGARPPGTDVDTAESLVVRSPRLPTVAPCLTSNYGKQPDSSDTNAGPMLIPMAVHENQRGEITIKETTGALNSGGGKPDQGYPAVLTNSVRRLTPKECERLQGFPDSYTEIPWRKGEACPDGPRYKVLGNSMAVPVMAWIGRRITEAEASDLDSDR